MAQRCLGWCLIAAVILGAAAVLPAAEKEKGPYVGPAEAFQNKETIAEKLATDIDFKFVETPLKDVVSLLQDVIGTTVVLNAKKLEEAALSIDTPITLELKGIQLRSALKLLLDDLNLAYVDRQQYLMITTPEDAESVLEIRIYNVRELLASKDPTLKPESPQDAAASPPVLGEQPSSARSTVGGMGIGMVLGSGMGLSMGSGGRAGGEALSEADKLCALVTTTVAPQSWDDVGGPASIVEYKGLLVISHTHAVHDEIERLLNMLHEASGLPAKALKVIR